jgi:hypothetical protein
MVIWNVETSIILGHLRGAMRVSRQTEEVVESTVMLYGGDGNRRQSSCSRVALRTT